MPVRRSLWSCALRVLRELLLIRHDLLLCEIVRQPRDLMQGVLDRRLTRHDAVPLLAFYPE